MNTTENLIPPQLQRSWGWLLTLGILFIVLGTIGLGMVVGITLVSVLFLGILLIIAGILQMADVFKSKHWRGALWHAIIAVLYVIAGLMITYDPILASTLITALIASVLIIIGTSRIIMALLLHGSKGWGWFLLAGFVTLALGILILIQWPWSGLWVIGLFITIELIVSGWTYIFMAFALKSAK